MRGPQPQPGPWAEAVGICWVTRCAFDGLASLTGPRLRAAAGRYWGETQAHCLRPPACHLACDVRTHCLSRNLECPAPGCGEQASDSNFSCASAV